MRIGACLSHQREVLSGVLQGFVICPLLFIVFLNNLMFSLKCGQCSFADDTNCYCNAITETYELRQEIDIIEKLMTLWDVLK